MHLISWQKTFIWVWTEQDLIHRVPLNPRDAYFGGRTNAIKLYYEVDEMERIHYIDITSMYPSVMSHPDNFDPVGPPTILKKHRDVFVPLDELFGLMKCQVQPPTNLYHPLLPTRLKSGKIQFGCEPMVGTWTSVELQLAVHLVYTILDVYQQHHFPRKSNELFKKHNDTFFSIKKEAKQQ